MTRVPEGVIVCCQMCNTSPHDRAARAQAVRLPGARGAGGAPVLYVALYVVEHVGQ